MNYDKEVSAATTQKQMDSILSRFGEAVEVFEKHSCRIRDIKNRLQSTPECAGGNQKGESASTPPNDILNRFDHILAKLGRIDAHMYTSISEIETII